MGCPPHLSASAFACSGIATPCDGSVRSANPAIQSELSGVMSIVATPACHVGIESATPREVRPKAATAVRNSRRFMVASMTCRINSFAELKVLAQRNKRPAVLEQGESDLEHPLAHPPELIP